MTVYYNEIDPYAAAWLRNLISAGLIAPGEVDTRSIEDVCPTDLVGFAQCHFFAGIGVWSYALRRAGWPDDRPIWTGSCPCQPFSAAGEGAGFADERHLWPHFFHLISQCSPELVLGEQVASKDADPWVDLVQNDMEALGYAFGAVPFPSAGVGAPHIRDRLYWVADAGLGQRDGLAIVRGLERDGQDAGRSQGGRELEPCSDDGRVGNASSQGLAQRLGLGGVSELTPGADAGQATVGAGVRGATIGSTGPTNGLWRDADWLFCRDGKWRPVEPGTFPLVDGSAFGVGRVRAGWDAPAGKERQGHRAGRLKGYGNAINAEAACLFAEAVMSFSCLTE